MIATRPLYTPAQLHEVYDRIRLPSRFRYEPGAFSAEVVRHNDGHGFLAALMSHTLANIPFENLELHYSPHHQISIDSDALFQKIVRQGTGRGGYCMENNVFLGTVMRSLGYEVMSVGARINHHGKGIEADEGRSAFSGWTHMVNLVTIRGKCFMVDVGFGSGGPTRPLALQEGMMETMVSPSQVVRLRKDAIVENEYAGNKLWIVEKRTREKGPWTPLYCFEDDVCFLPQDFEVMNHFTSTHRTSFFTYRLVCSQYLLNEDGSEVVGELILYENEVHRRLGGRREIVASFNTEEGRIAALEEWMGVTLSLAQREGIRGMVTELRGGDTPEVVQ